MKCLEDFLSYVCFFFPIIFLCDLCDFNIHVDGMSATVSEFISVIDSCCMTQYTDFPNHFHGHTLDHLLMALSKLSAISDVKG